MRVLLSILFLISVISCNRHKTDDLNIALEADSILLKSKSNLDTAVIVNQKSDSMTKETIIKVVKEIKFLNNEVEKYKQVNLLTNQIVATEKIIYKIDTVYIETKKNFWGKQKTTTSIKSDSIVNEVIDTTIQNQVTVDTTKIKIVN